MQSSKATALTICPDPPEQTKPARMNHIFVDYENVQPDDLSRINSGNFMLVIVIGGKQSSLRTEITEFALARPGQLRLVHTPCSGKNALDFVLACEVGRLIESDPHCYVHVISKDAGFDALISHLRANKKPCARHASISEMPILLSTKERFGQLVTNLRNPEFNRPKKRSSLANTVQQHFFNSLAPETIERTISLLIRDKVLKISEAEKVEYL